MDSTQNTSSEIELNKKVIKKHRQMSTRAGLCLSVSQVKNRLKKLGVSQRYSKQSVIAFTALAEYLMQDLVTQCAQNNVKTFTPEIIQQRVQQDSCLKEIFKNAVILI